MIYCIIYSIISLFINLEQSYSFTPPFFWTNIKEFDNWTIRGSATNLKNFIRLTPAIKNKYGAICQRIPTLFRDWSIKIQFSTLLSKDQNGTRTGGRGFWFHFTEEPCPLIPIVFNGICIWINTTITDKNGTFPINFIRNNNSVISPKNYTSIGRIQITKDGYIFLNISRIQNKIYIYTNSNIHYNDTYQTEILINKTEINDLIQFGYFTISALTTENAIANNDLIQIQTFSYSNHTNKIPTNLSYVNRKLIDDQYKSRKKKKQFRRSLMKTVERYSKEMKNKNSTLTNEKQNLSSAFIMLDEIKNRALSTITLTALINFIDTMMNNQIDSAYQKLEFSTESLNLIKKEIDDIWSNLRKDLISITNEIHKKMDELANETIEAVLKANFDKELVRNYKSSLKKQIKNDCNKYISKLLLIIVVVEFIILSIFIIVSHSKNQRNRYA